MWITKKLFTQFIEENAKKSSYSRIYPHYQQLRKKVNCLLTNECSDLKKENADFKLSESIV